VNPTIDRRSRIGASLVLYESDSQMLQKLLSSIANTPLTIELVVVDNSPTAKLSDIFQDIEYIKYYHDPTNYSLLPVQKILGILKWILSELLTCQ
jgi:hypothetical protein